MLLGGCVRVQPFFFFDLYTTLSIKLCKFCHSFSCTIMTEKRIDKYRREACAQGLCAVIKYYWSIASCSPSPA